MSKSKRELSENITKNAIARASSKRTLKPGVASSSTSGSLTIKEKIAKKTPWIFGDFLRKPKVRFPKLKRKRISISFPTPSKNLAFIGIYIGVFILQIGTIYLYYNDRPSLGADANGNPIWLWPEIHDAFIVESIVASILISLSSIGFLVLYHSTKYNFDRSFAWRMLIIGAVLILITFVCLQYMIYQKAPDSFD
jgi:hypothetical protein